MVSLKSIKTNELPTHTIHASRLVPVLWMLITVVCAGGLVSADQTTSALLQETDMQALQLFDSVQKNGRCDLTPVEPMASFNTRTQVSLWVNAVNTSAPGFGQTRNGRIVCHALAPRFPPACTQFPVHSVYDADDSHTSIVRF